MSQARSHPGLMIAILAILGLTAGAALGLLLGWVVMPVEYVDTKIAELAPECKDDYILLVATAYYLDGDLEQARSRLAELELPNTGQWISSLGDRYISKGRDEEDIRALAALAEGLGIASPMMLDYLASPTPLPTNTPLPTDTAAPSDTPVPTDTAAATDERRVTADISTDTPPPPTDTAAPKPTATPVTATKMPKPTKPPQPSKTPKPKPPTKTPAPTQPPATQWSWTARLVGPGEDAQSCGAGNLQIRVTVIGPGGNQLGGVWIYDKYSKQYQVTGNVDSPDWGPGETKFEYGGGGGGSLCVAEGQGGACVSEFTRDMPCYYLPPIEDLHSSGYCTCCGEGDISLERCRQLIEEGICFPTGAEHFSWRVVFQRNW